MDIVIRPSEGDWSSVADPTQAIADWEKQSGKRLPDDYRRFVTTYNGGRIYPLIFDRKIPDEVFSMGEPATFINTFYDWEMVADIWNGGVFDKRNPPGMLVVGSSPGGIEVLLSLEDESYGQVFLWLHSQSAWGQDDNNKAWPQADSFKAFVEGLYDNDEQEGHDYWYLPSKKGLEKKVEF